VGEDFPDRHFNVRSLLNLSRNIQLDLMAYYMDEMSAGGHIPDFWRVDVRLAWKPREHLEFELIGQNLFEDRHPEYWGLAVFTQTEIQRNVYAKCTWRF
jgi:iron complex outermembrane receptor protein